MNSINLIGRLTKDPIEIADGTGVQLRIAYDQSGKGITTGYIDVTVWGNSAPACMAYLFKGAEIGVTGRLQYTEWYEMGLSTDGGKRTGHKIVADRIDFLRKPLPHEE